jgi:hypothetical protein
MFKILNILRSTLCLLLMIHLLAISVCDDYFLKLFNKSTIEQTLDIEEDIDNDSEIKSLKFDDEYVVNSLNHSIHFHSFGVQHNCSVTSFQYLQIALPQRISEILIPPPRAKFNLLYQVIYAKINSINFNNAINARFKILSKIIF